MWPQEDLDPGSVLLFHKATEVVVVVCVCVGVLGGLDSRRRLATMAEGVTQRCTLTMNSPALTQSPHLSHLTLMLRLSTQNQRISSITQSMTCIGLVNLNVSLIC